MFDLSFKYRRRKGKLNSPDNFQRRIANTRSSLIPLSSHISALVHTHLSPCAAGLTSQHIITNFTFDMTFDRSKAEAKLSFLFLQQTLQLIEYQTIFKVQNIQDTFLQGTTDPEKGEVDGEWRKLHKVLHNLHSSSNIVRIIRSSRLKWMRHLALMGK
jgi:hypothetical protein